MRGKGWGVWECLVDDVKVGGECGEMSWEVNTSMMRKYYLRKGMNTWWGNIQGRECIVNIHLGREMYGGLYLWKEMCAREISREGNIRWVNIRGKNVW